MNQIRNHQYNIIRIEIFFRDLSLTPSHIALKRLYISAFRGVRDRVRVELLSLTITLIYSITHSSTFSSSFTEKFKPAFTTCLPFMAYASA